MKRSLIHTMLILMVASTLGSAGTVLAVPSGSAGPASSGDAVWAWNENAGDAALAACIAPTGNPLHESRMYAMMHVAIHDALNAIHRRSQPYAFHGHASRRASTDAAVATAARDVLVPVLGEIPAPFPHECIDAGDRGRGSRLRGRARRDPGRAGQEEGRQRGSEGCRGHPRASSERRLGHAVAGLRLSAGHRPGEYRFTPGHTVRVRTGVGEGDTFVLDDSSQFRAAMRPTT